MSVLSPPPKIQLFDNNGALAEGYKIFTYAAGTSTKQDSYTDSTESTLNTNPIVLDTRGECNLWLGRDKTYKIIFAIPTSADPPVGADIIWSIDNVLGEIVLIPSEKSGNYTITSSDRNRIFLVDASGGNVTISANPVADLGNGFLIYIKKMDSSANTVTFNPSGSETVDDVATYTLTRQYDSSAFVTDTDEWWSLNQSLLSDLRDTNSNIVVDTSAVTNPAASNILAYAATGSNSPGFSIVSTSTDLQGQLKGKGTGGWTILDGSSNKTLVTSNATTPSSQTMTGNVYLPPITSSDSRTNTVAYPLTVYGHTSGTAAASIGTGIKIRAKSADETPADFGALIYTASDVTAGSEDTYLSSYSRVAGAALAESYRWSSTNAFAQLHTHANTANRTITWPDHNLNKFLVQQVSTITGAVATGTTTIPADDTIPQSGEGVQFMTLSITPTSATNVLLIYASPFIYSNATVFMGCALFQDSTANALAAVARQQTSGESSMIPLFYSMVAGTTSSTTFKIRVGGSSAGTWTFNGTAGARSYGGVMCSSMIIMEVSP